MKRKLAKGMILTGIVCVIGALSLFIYNNITASNAAQFAERIVSQLQERTGRTELPATAPTKGAAADGAERTGSLGSTAQEDASGGAAQVGMPYRVIEEYEFIGYLSLPSLRLNLPVMADWSYEKLNISPCRYSGAPATDDFVIAAHNYTGHFGFISDLHEGDTVSFIDVNGKQTDYHVELIDTLSPTAVEDMTAGDYDLTLFTCTYSGQARVTVRLNRMSV